MPSFAPIPKLHNTYKIATCILVAKRRVWDKQNITTVDVIEFYGVSFFTRSYNLTQDEVYEFVLGAIENSSIQNDFKLSNHGLVLESFDKFYKSRNE